MENKVEQLEEVKETKKKGGKGLIVLVILLLLICCGLGAFIFMNKDKLIEKEIKQVEKENEKDSVKKCDEVKVYETTDKKVKDLIGNISVSLGGEWKYFETYANNKKVEANDIEQLRAYHIAERRFFQENKQSITLDEFTKEVQKYLGKNYEFKPESINYKGGSCPQYNYDASKKIFNKQQTACGWTTGPVGIYYDITKASELNNELELSVRVIFGDNNDTYYSDYARTKELQKYEGYTPVFDFSKGSLYKFIFKLEDGNYVFVSSEPVN